MSHGHISGIEKKAEENIRRWIKSQRELAERFDKPAKSFGPYVAISRETGTGGSEIARLVGDQLGWSVLDREIIDYMAEQFGSTPGVVEAIDEKHRSWVGEMLSVWSEHHEISNESYLNRLKRLFLLAGEHGEVVIVGRGAHYILPRENGLSVRLLAPLEFRTQQIQATEKITAKEARKLIERFDRQHDEFVRDTFHHRDNDPHEHDLVINVANLTPQEAADVIKDAAARLTQKIELNESVV